MPKALFGKQKSIFNVKYCTYFLKYWNEFPGSADFELYDNKSYK